MFDDELFHVLRRVVQEHTARWQVAVPELTKPQYAVLRAVEQEPGIEQSVLTVAAASTKATLAEMLQRLERRGLIERQGDRRDRRRRYVHLSEQGRQVLAEVVPRAVEVDASFTAHLSVADQQGLLRQLHRMLVD